MNYYLTKESASVGPFTLAEIQSKIAAGEALPADLCWYEGQAEWVPINTIPEFKKIVPPPPSTPSAPLQQASSTQQQAAPLPTVTLDLNETVKVIKAQGLGIRIAPYIFCLLCFFMPFTEISNNDRVIFAISGAQLVTGTQLTEPMTGVSRPLPSDLFAVISLAFVIAALAFSISASSSRAKGCAIASGLAILVLLVTKWGFEQGAAEQAQGTSLTYSFVYGFWLVILSLVAGLVLSLLRARKRGEAALQ